MNDRPDSFGSSKNIKAAILTASVSRRAGGLFWAVRSLSQSLLNSGCMPRVFSSTDNDTDKDIKAWAPVPVSTVCPKGPVAFSFQPGLLSSLKNFNPDIVHCHGLWLYPSLASKLFSCQKKPYVVSPHGMLDPWAVRNSVWKKKIVGVLFENSHLANASCLHALCDAEYHAIRDYGLSNPVTIIPNGVDLPELEKNIAAPEWHARLPDNAKVLFFLSRLHPKKGLANLLEAWSIVCETGLPNVHQWHLVIAGWDQGGHQLELTEQAKRLGIADSIHFVNSQFDEAKEASFRRADAFVLPSFSEGLPMSVLEAWSYGLPVLMTRQCNLTEGYEANAAILTEPDIQSLCHGLKKLFIMTDLELNAMGSNGRDLVSRKFTWNKIGEQMMDVYRWLLGVSVKPNSVRLD